jgi:hypothetical protein
MAEVDRSVVQTITATFAPTKEPIIQTAVPAGQKAVVQTQAQPIGISGLGSAAPLQPAVQPGPGLVGPSIPAAQSSSAPPTFQQPPIFMGQSLPFQQPISRPLTQSAVPLSLPQPALAVPNATELPNGLGLLTAVPGIRVSELITNEEVTSGIVKKAAWAIQGINSWPRGSMASVGQLMFNVQEQHAQGATAFLAQKRPLNLLLLNSDGAVVLKMQQTWLHRGKSLLRVYDHADRLLGSLSQKKSFYLPGKTRLAVLDIYDREIMNIDTSRMSKTFQKLRISRRQGMRNFKVGSVWRLRGVPARASPTDINEFDILFPTNADWAARALLLAAAIELDLIWYEKFPQSHLESGVQQKMKRFSFSRK